MSSQDMSDPPAAKIPDSVESMPAPEDENKTVIYDTEVDGSAWVQGHTDDLEDWV